MRPVYVSGTGLHPFGRFPDRSLTTIGAVAVRAALAEAGIGRGEFQAAYCGSVYGGVAAAPAFSDMARYAIQRLGIEPAPAVAPPPHVQAVA